MTDGKDALNESESQEIFMSQEDAETIILATIDGYGRPVPEDDLVKVLEWANGTLAMARMIDLIICGDVVVIGVQDDEPMFQLRTQREEDLARAASATPPKDATP